MQPEQQQRIMGYFIEEAKDHLNTIEQGLLNLQGTLDDSEMVNEVFRAAHSVKGGAAMLGLTGIQQASHQLEDYFKILKETPGIRADQKLETLLLQVSDTLSGLLEQLQTPFGLSDGASEVAIGNAKPIFREIEQHLKHLISIANPSAARSTSSVSPKTLIFQQQVPIVMRDLLDLFKQLDTNAAIRQTLQAKCGDLISLTGFFQLSGWNNLLGLISRAIEHPENSGRVMAGVIIKDLKLAQEKVLVNQDAAIVPSSTLMNLVPLATVSSLDMGILSDTDSLFGDDLDLGLDFEDLDEGDNGALFDDLHGLNDLNLEVTSSPTDFAALLEDSGSGPEMGIAELNSLADLFEGEVPELTSTWQEEEVLTRAGDDSLALDLTTDPTSSDFEAFLLEPESTDSAPMDSSLDDLFGEDLLADLSEPFSLSTPESRINSSDSLDLSFFDDVHESGTEELSAGDDLLGLSMFGSDVADTQSGDVLTFDELPELDSFSGRRPDELTEDASSSLDELGDLFMGMDDADLSFGDELEGASLREEVTPTNHDDFDDLNLMLGEVSKSDFDDLFLSSDEVSSPADSTDDVLGISELFGAEEGGIGDARSAASEVSVDDRSEELNAEDDIFSFLSEDPLTVLDLTDPTAESELFHDFSDSLFSNDLDLLNDLDNDTEMQFDPDLRLNSLATTDNDWTMPGSELDDLVQGGEDYDFLSELNELDTESQRASLNSDRTLGELGELEGLVGLDDLEGDLGSLDDLSHLDDLASLETANLDSIIDDDPWLDFSTENVDEPNLGLVNPPAELSLDSLDFDSLDVDSLAIDRLETDHPDPDASIAYDDMELPLDLWDDLPVDTIQEEGGLDPLGLLGGAALGLGALGLGAAGMMQSRSSTPSDGSSGIESETWIESEDELNFDTLSDESLDELNFDDLNLDDLENFDDLEVANAGNLSIDDFSDDDFGDLDRLLDEPAARSNANPDPFTDLEELLSSNSDLSIVAVTTSAAGITTAMVGVSALNDPEFDDLEKLLEDTDNSNSAPPAGIRGALAARRTVRPNSKGFSEQTMRVPVKHLDNLSNLVGELVVNRNTLEQDQERLRQSLDNLLYQVQQLSDVGQRMQDLYERSLLESSLLASRQSYRMAGSLSIANNLAESEKSNDMEYDPLEMDRFTGFHSLSQEMIELIVRVRESASDIEFIVDETDQVTRNFRQVTTQLQEGLTRSRMVPFAQTADRLPRAVRDIAMKCGKQAELVIEGRETPIDKMLLEHLYDPMTHLVNNAITHGIETPEERRRAGKPETGRITIRAFHQGNQTVISVSDDGAGVDIDRVKQKAIEKNLITAAESQTMGRIDVYDLLFHPGFTTRDQADDFAGRGVGMDVVRTSLSEIRGAVTTDSGVGRGTTFTIRLPLTLSISKALCCISDRARIAFPMDGVEDMLDVPKDRLQMNAEGQPCIMWRDTQLLLRPLTELLAHNRHLGRGNVYGGSQDDDMISVVVLRSAGNYLALQVDQVLGEQEIVIKQLEGPVPKPVGVAGATVLGDGRIMPIADVLELIDLSVGRIRRDSGSMWDQGGAIGVDALPAKTEPMVLIVDDSITVRELLSMTFNKVGYRVEQARDGQEAWEKLRSGLPCDIVFCDIEMPRMDGLELLSRIQKDPNLKALPIAMLTSRGADRHRQMASSLGASGYFTKPYLEEALLDAAARMLRGEVLLISDRDE